MNNKQLIKSHCVPCEGGVEPLGKKEIGIYQSYLKSTWEVSDDYKKISKEYKFKDFKESMKFVNKVAELAEDEGHHPDLYISYNRVKIELTTHAINGLSTNDFIIASKIELI